MNEAKKDYYCLTGFLKSEDLFESDGPEEIELSFCLDQIEIEPRKSAEAKYRLISEIDAKPKKN